MDTDAAGIYHWTCVFRLAEAAEAALHTALGTADRVFGVTPRMAVSAEFVRGPCASTTRSRSSWWSTTSAGRRCAIS